MYQPRHFQNDDIANSVALIEANPLGTLVLHSSGSFEVNHIPFIVDHDGSGITTLRAHIPKANALAELAMKPLDCVVVFQGAQGYVSPSWYATKQRHGKVVPTWNYSVVHVHGEIQTVSESSWVMQQLQELTELNEGKRDKPWQVSDAPGDFTEALVSALVGLQIVVSKVEAKTKASQNQPLENRESVLQSLSHEQPESDFSAMMHVVNKDKR